jgi:hypothetical protein
MKSQPSPEVVTKSPKVILRKKGRDAKPPAKPRPARES